MLVLVKPETNKISVIRYRLWPNIGSLRWLDLGDLPSDISVKANISAIFKISVSVKVWTNKISDINFGQISVISYWLDVTDLPSLVAT